MTIPLPSRARIAVVGDAMMDVTARIDSDIVYASDTPAEVTQQPGGSGANTAAWLGAGREPVRYVGAVGADVFGDEILTHLQAQGVDCQVIRSPDYCTGTCIVIVDGSGERTMFPDTGANSALTVEHVRATITSELAHVHVSGYTLMNPACRVAGETAIVAARESGASVSLDPSSVGPLESNLELMQDALPKVDVLLANAAEAAILTGQDDPELALLALHEAVPVVIIKLGPRGAMAIQNGHRLLLPAVPVDAVDSTGAGDAFTAGFLPSWLTGADLAQSLRAGLLLGAEAVSRVGAGPGAR